VVGYADRRLSAMSRTAPTVNAVAATSTTIPVSMPVGGSTRAAVVGLRDSPTTSTVVATGAEVGGATAMVVATVVAGGGAVVGGAVVATGAVTTRGVVVKTGTVVGAVVTTGQAGMTLDRSAGHWGPPAKAAPGTAKLKMVASANPARIFDRIVIVSLLAVLRSRGSGPQRQRAAMAPGVQEGKVRSEWDERPVIRT
jgi:hypothetical protein